MNTTTLTAQPSVRFRKDRHFYLRYDGLYLLACLAVIGVLVAVGWTPWVAEWSWSLLLWLPLACYLQIMASVLIHNCSHGNWPRPINRLVGEVLGLIVLTRYASWEIIHRRHHKYSDDQERDPHPCVRSYWRFLWRMLVNVERQLQGQFFDWHGGDTPANRAAEKRRALVSYGTNVALVTAWYLFLGAPVFVTLFVPAQIIGVLHLAHFNWSTHNGVSDTGAFHPVNLNHGYFWLGNKIWFGIYWHDNHHRQANLFNPGALERHVAHKRDARAAQAA